MTVKGNTYTDLGDGSFEIALTQGRKTFIDADSVAKCRQHTWRFGNGYARTHVRCPDGKRRQLCLNRFLLGGWAGEGLSWVADHINGDPLDNRLVNLQRLTNRQNATKGRSSLLKPGKSSRFPGVTWHKSNQKWRARITVQGKLQHLGLFESELEAVKAYNQALAITQGFLAQFFSSL